MIRKVDNERVLEAERVGEGQRERVCNGKRKVKR